MLRDAQVYIILHVDTMRAIHQREQECSLAKSSQIMHYFVPTYTWSLARLLWEMNNNPESFRTLALQKASSVWQAACHSPFFFLFYSILSTFLIVGKQH